MARSMEQVEKEISKSIEQGKIILGKERTLKLMKLGKIRKIYLARNTPDIIRKEIEIIGKVEGVEIEEIDKTSNQVGVMVGKRFNVLVLSIMK